MLLAALTAAATLTGGRSVDGHPIVAVRSGSADAPRTVLVVGDIHGNERAGRAVVTAIRRRRPRAGTQVWTVASATTERCYYVAAELLEDGRSMLHLRLRPTRNGQAAGIRDADDYLTI